VGRKEGGGVTSKEKWHHSINSTCPKIMEKKIQRKGREEVWRGECKEPISGYQMNTHISQKKHINEKLGKEKQILHQLGLQGAQRTGGTTSGRKKI